MRLSLVEEFGDQRMVIEKLLHDTALDALASAVDDPKLPETCGVRSVEVFVDD
jgi:hypothetical protein